MGVSRPTRWLRKFCSKFTSQGLSAASVSPPSKTARQKITPTVWATVEVPLAARTAPSNLAATVLSATQISLSWTNNDPSALGTKIYMSTDGGKTYSWFGTAGAGASTFTASGLSANTTYYFKVASYDATDNSVFSNIVSALTLAS